MRVLLYSIRYEKRKNEIRKNQQYIAYGFIFHSIVWRMTLLKWGWYRGLWVEGGHAHEHNVETLRPNPFPRYENRWSYYVQSLFYLWIYCYPYWTRDYISVANAPGKSTYFLPIIYVGHPQAILYLITWPIHLFCLLCGTNSHNPPPQKKTTKKQQQTNKKNKTKQNKKKQQRLIKSRQLIDAWWLYMHQWTGLPLVQAIACRLFGAKSVPEPVPTYWWLEQ